MKLFGVVGWKNSGKTGLMERLVAEISGRGFRVSTLKHAHHAVDVDQPGKDSYRHRQAGAVEVVLASRKRWAMMHELRDTPEPELEDLLPKLTPVDLVLVEGYKRSRHPKIEAHRVETGKGLLAREDTTVRAVASNGAPEGLPVPVIDLDDTAAIADLILREAGLTAQPAEDQPPSQLRNDCFALPPGVDWTPVADALDLLRDGLTCVTGTETLAARDALGRILAAPVTALRANPPAANSAVDGYGFAHAALGPEGGALPLAGGRAAAGVPHPHPVPEGQALRILTGASLPAGVDTVVLEEDVTLDADTVRFGAGLKRGANTRKAGEDKLRGDTVLDAGHRVRAPDLALLASVGVAEVAVRIPLRVGVLSTGDELATPGETDDPARIFDANRPMLLGIAAGWAYRPVDLGQAPDDRDGLRAILDDAAERCDVILTSGGASAGDEDHMSAILQSEGTMTSWRIALKPGRPLALGLWRGVPVFGLPGNPVAALVCALIFARPALSVLAGGPWQEPLGFTVPAAFSKRKKPGRSEYLRARLSPEGTAEVFASEGSGRVSGLSWADGLVALGPEAQEIAPGTPVRYLPYAGLLTP
ncbi:putative molybdopterin biosynthesis protein [Dinoroseobacter shibae DFL 12 = DSM 16493]|jgi:molybdopterin molybdotransferase|uniref:Molybdopterin molybdenumtransferase n=1 Tax=Dinoroseobacter shibae (strain DSM 16493 / NCIMB 14021 / DFL 12) TaxID=398580 RepID=A8LMU2_DINSH|nr:bifunctional molybdopterin-guanine dinucleotide biosynthesis adaptor protein MobB/molybdopterin molybdotransferase MoeA [Dinoroseobacter shibae]ABV95017.1 putative molybdopterin biosynthesis protein [Dinoroseobacter shibae DFL 12 = DSM 16493]URF46435.1 bifunctional molybdopterin-guanine dinucleotide biosynthesis adaptor protein MobB/molybdopterin molybdotransferase MoeA [Dinoroseobacter shibae]URF50741.1 bifunctional molybdopterin-guanine dinucleotide biosynthesis adaptor protein MobB/molybdo